MNKQRNKLLIFVFLFAFSVSGFSQTLKFDGVSEVKPLKRGKEYSVKWSGGTKEQAIKIELHDGKGRVQSWDETLNDGENAVKLNSRLKPGSNYSFRIQTSDELVSSQNVEIKRRIPLALTVSAIIIIVPTVMALLSNSNNHLEPIELADPSKPN